MFLGDPAIDATNWRAEHAIRQAVVTRKVCGGNRTARGAATQQILASVLRTVEQRGLDPADVFTSLVRARRPIVSPRSKHHWRRLTVKQRRHGGVIRLHSLS